MLPTIARGTESVWFLTFSLTTRELPPGCMVTPAEFRLPTLTHATDLAIVHAKEQDQERLCRSVSEDPLTGCWLWTGARDAKGYGIIHIGGSTVRVHRATFWWFSTQLLRDGYGVDHLCRVRHCCNPDHLEAVTHQESVRRGRAGANWTGKTQAAEGSYNQLLTFSLTTRLEPPHCMFTPKRYSAAPWRASAVTANVGGVASTT
jgi:hypothetical protein